MKKFVKVLLGLFALIIAIAVIYWQFNKKKIVRNALETVISAKTDSLYFIHYDSSTIDEVNGNARFFNVVLQSDSLQRQLLQFDTAEATQIYNIQVSEVVVEGANIPALLGNEKLHANLIRIIRPVIYVINSGSGNSDQLSKTDTLAIYEKLLGKFKSIEAGMIIIEDGQLYVTHKMEEPYVSIKGIGITMNNVLIDSTKDYNNILSYFVNDVNLSVETLTIKNKLDNSKEIFSGLEYNAKQKLLKLNNFRQMNEKSGTIIFDIRKLYVKGLNTDSFILKKQLKAEELLCKGELLTFYTGKAKPGVNDIIEMDNHYFDKALLNSINISKMKILVYNRDKPKEPPFTLTNVSFSASEIQNIYSGTSIKNLIGKSNWNLSADGFSFYSRNKVYKLSVGAFNINTVTGKAHIEYFTVKSQIPEETFMKNQKEQTDLYNISINNINLTGVDTKKLIAEKMLIANLAFIQPVIKVSCDRTLPPYTGSKIGNFPHQLIQKIKFPIFINKIIASKGYIAYTERSSQSEQKGTLFFSKVNGTIENVTNISSFIKRNNMLTVNASAQLLGVSSLQTKWRLPLNTPNGSFYISGNAGSFNAESLNALIEPLALASIKSGIIKGIQFNMNGNDNAAKGSSTILYNDFKIEALKKDSNDLKKRDLASFFANLLIKNDNPMNGNTRKGEIDIERDKTRSFFNLVWKGIFKAAKRTAFGKDDQN